MSAKKFPAYPTVVFGYVNDICRVETNGGGDDYLFQFADRFLRNIGPVWRTRDGEEKQFAITHLQKLSKFGFLWMRPFCFHFWFQRKIQERDGDGNWIPGSEHTWYGRTPGWRWDAGDGKFIRTKGFLSNKHWD